MAAARNNSFLFLSVIVVLILLHCGEDIKPAQQDFNQDFLFICMKMISRDNEKQRSFLLGLQYVTPRTAFQPTGKRRNLETQCMACIQHKERRMPQILLWRPPSGVKWQTPGYQLFSPVPQMVTQQGANNWMTSCPSGWHRWQQIRGGWRGEEEGYQWEERWENPAVWGQPNKTSTLLQLKGNRCQMLSVLLIALTFFFFFLPFHAKRFKTSDSRLQKCWEVNSFVSISTGSLQLMLILLNGWEGGGWQGGRLLSFSKPIESVVSECVVFLTRASARLMGVCLGAFRGRSRRLFTKTYVSDYDRWGPGRGLGGQDDGGLWCLRAEEPLLMCF